MLNCNSLKQQINSLNNVKADFEQKLHIFNSDKLLMEDVVRTHE
jgi:hypothetical protein